MIHTMAENEDTVISRIDVKSGGRIDISRKVFCYLLFEVVVDSSYATSPPTSAEQPFCNAAGVKSKAPESSPCSTREHIRNDRGDAQNVTVRHQASHREVVKRDTRREAYAGHVCRTNMDKDNCTSLCETSNLCSAALRLDYRKHLSISSRAHDPDGLA